VDLIRRQTAGIGRFGAGRLRAPSPTKRRPLRAMVRISFFSAPL
jgi:hypothetical protein